MARYGMVIDLKRCIGCDTCTVACKAVNATSRGIMWNRVLKYETGKYPHSKLNFLPVLCMHCEEAECEKVCPTGATTRREDGIVTVDNDKCIGCRYCIAACPYDARHFDFGRNFNEPMMDYEKAPNHEYGIRRIRENLRSPIENVR